jgi:uncharacterized protein (TIGR01777 family)
MSMTRRNLHESVPASYRRAGSLERRAKAPAAVQSASLVQGVPAPCTARASSARRPALRIFERRTELPVTREALDRWHANPGAFERLVPPWTSLRLVSRVGDGIDVGTRLELEMRQCGLPLRWTAVHVAREPGHGFVDVQERGPFASWRHEHRFLDAGPGRSVLVDRIEYALPLGAVGALLARRVVDRALERTFRYRHEVTMRDVEQHQHALAAEGSGAGGVAVASAPSSSGPAPTTWALRIAVTGATGLIGRALVPFLRAGGHEVHRLVREKSAAKGTDLFWNPATAQVDAAGLEGVDVVVHLAGENVGRRWTAARREAIVRSRVDGTALLARTLAGLRRPPRVFVSASAVGYYGDTGDRWVDDRSGPGKGFLAETCVAWERAADPARQAGIRVVHPRLGVVLTPAGGALARLLPLYRWGAGGPVGDGRQFFPWVAIDDVLRALHFAIGDAGLDGPFDVVAPGIVTSAEFARVLGRVLHRPAFLPAPAFALRAAFGEMAEQVLLAGQRVRPRKLDERGFEFAYPELEGALRHLLGR